MPTLGDIIMIGRGIKPGGDWYDTPGSDNNSVHDLPTPLAQYRVFIYSDFRHVEYTGLIQSFTLTETFDAPAMECSMEMASLWVPLTELHKGKITTVITRDKNLGTKGTMVDIARLLRVGSGIRIFGDTLSPDGRVTRIPRDLTKRPKINPSEIFRGYVFSKTISGSTSQDTLSLTAYDNMIYLAKNDYDFVYKNKTATEIIRDLCSRAGIRLAPLGKDFVDTGVKIQKLTSFGLSLYDTCLLALQKTRQKTGKRYRLRSEKGLVVLRLRHVDPAGSWLFNADELITGTSRNTSIEDLVTSVRPRISGAEGKVKYGTPVVNASMEKLYGRHRRIVDVEATKASNIRKEVKNLMKESGTPKTETSITTIGVNTIRAGDYVRTQEREDTRVVNGWYVDQVVHNVSSSMHSTDMTLVKTIAEADVDKVDEDTDTPGGKTTYVKVTGADGKPIHYLLGVSVFTPSGTIDGTVYDGTEAVIKVDKDSPLASRGVGSKVECRKGRHSIRADVIQKGDFGASVVISRAVAEHLEVTGGTIDFAPLRAKTTGSTTSSTSEVQLSGTASPYDNLFVQYAAVNNVPAALVKAIAATETRGSFNTSAVSPAGATGLMQVMPGTAQGMGWSSSEGPLTNPEISIKYGAKYVANQYRAFGGDLTLTAAAYNAGPGNARRWQSIPETAAYVPIFLNYYRTYSAG